MTTFQVDPESLNRYRQDIIDTVSKWSRSGGGDINNIQMALAANGRRDLRRCVMCGCEEPPQHSTGGGGGLQNSPGSRHLAAAAASSPGVEASMLDQIMQEFYDHGWFRYDGLDHCFSCARRLACEILAPHVAASRSEASTTVLRRVLDAEKAEQAATATAGGGGEGGRSSSVGSTGDAAAAGDAATAAKPAAPWHCMSCGSDNDPGAAACSVCEVARPPPLICPYCNQDANEVEFCPNDPNDPMENHLTFSRSDPLMNSGSRYGTSSSTYGRLMQQQQKTERELAAERERRENSRHGRHDTWSCENQRCRTLNLGIVHPDACRNCTSARTWHCVGCKHRYSSSSGSSSYCPKCYSRQRAGSVAELEERELCKLTNLTVDQARRQRRTAAMLDGAKLRVTKRIEKKLGLVNVKAADDGNCLFHALSFQLFRHSGLHHLLRLLAVEHIIMEKDNFLPFVHGMSDDDGSGSRADGSSRNANASPSSPSSQRESSQQRMDRIFVDYVRKMSMDRTWGDALVLHAIARVFNVQIHVISGARECWHNVIGGGGGQQQQQQHQGTDSAASSPQSSKKPITVIFISFIAELHYNSVVLSQKDADNQALPYRRWVEMGELNASSLLNGGGGGGSVPGTPSSLVAINGAGSGSFLSDINQLPGELPNGDMRTQQQQHPQSSAQRDHHSEQPPPLALISVTTTSTATSIKKNDPFDRVTIFFPDEHGDPGGFLGFGATGRMDISKTDPSFFQRFPAETPRSVRDAFPHKASGSKSFVLLDELGKNVVCTLMPMMLGTQNVHQQSVHNEPAIFPIETLQRTQGREPRVTVITSFRDGSCAIGPWMFVVDWRGRKACIVMETPSQTAKPPARIDFVEERLLHQCQSCGKFWVLKEGGKKHMCQAAMAAAQNYRR